ncbi:MAG: LCP family protein [Firmicutes bacterium]|uniref:LytR family transcriptional regulator n=1 Tax=Sulfobacillus benefaciens TaxID=453960 RepID=A0A2T2XBD0_9FIRM|nr:LCP family protein [Bacillota bacterium]MCL5012453.1 LCP family protein [Bacillota bacterium]PSR31833.1 MAG: LytR family transcriptional regulator [Sulfobacillus benefaciens]
MVSQRRADATRKTQRKTGKVLAWIIAILVVLAAGGYAIYRYYANPKNLLLTPKVVHYNQASGNPAFDHRITFLLMGNSLATVNNHVIKNGKVRDRSDTIILVSFDPKTKQIGVMSIPRDTRVALPGIGKTKIAEATYFGGVQEMVQTIQKTFHVPVDYYAYVSMFQFEKIINDMGGLTVNVPQNEVYQPGGPLGINLKKGVHHLNGQQVLEFARFRQTATGDIGRIQQQQQLLHDMAQQLLKPQNIVHWPTLAGDVIHALSYTNLSANQLISLGLAARHVPLSTVRYATVPGYGSTHMDPYMHQQLSYWTYDPHLSRVLIQDVLLASPLTKSQKKSVKIFVASGTGTLAPAQALAHKLSAQGYTVVGIGWANHHNHHRTVILNTTGDKWLGSRLAALTGPSLSSFTAYHTTPWDVKITVGSDYVAKP